uniref:Glycosyl transferase family 25 domain-containing protein n=1 Tax=viral metagenome TaxID=1070528 RepID=A0A6C0K6W8_9ZZZZ
MIHALYINLDERPDRRESVESELKKIDCTFERIPAVKHTLGLIGCAESHIKCIQLAKERNLPRILVVEDDLEWVQNPHVVNHALNTLPPHDVAVLAPIISAGSKVRRVNTQFVTGSVCQTTLAYVCERHYYDTLLKNLCEGHSKLVREYHLHGTYALDQYWKRLQILDNWIFAHPTLAIQKPGVSTIEGKHVDYTAPYNNVLNITYS